jgi:hypothetical protein
MNYGLLVERQAVKVAAAADRVLDVPVRAFEAWAREHPNAAEVALSEVRGALSALELLRDGLERVLTRNAKPRRKP